MMAMIFPVRLYCFVYVTILTFVLLIEQNKSTDCKWCFDYLLDIKSSLSIVGLIVNMITPFKWSFELQVISILLVLAVA